MYVISVLVNNCPGLLLIWKNMINSDFWEIKPRVKGNMYQR